MGYEMSFLVLLVLLFGLLASTFRILREYAAWCSCSAASGRSRGRA